MNKPLQLETIEDVSQNEIFGFYDFNEKKPDIKKLKSDYVFDENLTIKQNKDLIKKHNESYEEQMENYNKAYNDKINEFNNDMIIVIGKELNVSREKANKIFSYVYNEYHSGGRRDVITNAEKLVELLKGII